MSNFPSVPPTLNLQFKNQPTPEAMLSHLKSVGATFTRDSEATYFDQLGILRTAPAGYPRPHFVAGVPKGLLIEESQVNLITNSNDLNDFSPTRSSFTTGVVLSPDGGFNGSTITPTTDAANDYISQAINIGGGIASKSFTFSVWLKINTGIPTITLFLYGSSGIEEVANNVNIQITGEWVRYSVSQSFSAGAVSTAITFRVDVRRNDSSNATLGDKVDVFGAQLEELSYPTSYIPTGGSAVNREADDCYIDGEAFTSFYKQKEGTFVMQLSGLLEGATQGILVVANSLGEGGTRSFGILKTTDEDLDGAMNGNYITQLLLATDYSLTESLKLAFKADGTGYSFFANSESGKTGITAPNETVNILRIGGWVSAQPVLNGAISELVYYPIALDDAFLIASTRL